MKQSARACVRTGVCVVSVFVFRRACFAWVLVLAPGGEYVGDNGFGVGFGIFSYVFEEWWSIVEEWGKRLCA